MMSLETFLAALLRFYAFQCGVEMTSTGLR